MTWQNFRLSGYAPDLPPDALPPDIWSSVTNIQFRDGVAERSVGDYDVASSGTPITRYDHVQPLLCNPAGTVYNGLIYGGLDIAGPVPRIGQYVVGIGHGDITPAWGAGTNPVPNDWTGGSLSGGVLINIPYRDPCWSDPAGAVTILTAGSRYNALRPYKYMAVGIGDVVTAAARNTVAWSASAVPGAAPSVWVPAAGNDAGSFDVTSAVGGGQLIDGGQLGEDFIIYSDRAAWVMTYVGGATVMTNRRLPGATGVLSRNCYADLGVAHLVLTPDDVVLVDSTGPRRSLLDGRLRRTLFQNIYSGAGRAAASQVWHDRRRGVVYIAVPGQAAFANPTIGFMYSIADDRWGFRNLTDSTTNATTGAYTTAVMATISRATPGDEIPRLLVAKRGDGVTLASSALYYADADTAGTGALADSYLYKDDLDFGDANAVKLVKGIRIRGTAAATVTLKVAIGTKFAADEAYTYSAEQDYVLPTSQRADFLVTGRWISVRIRFPTPMIAARVLGFDVDVQPAGVH